MNRNYGATDIKYAECINYKLNKWRIRWDIQPEYETTDEGDNVQRGVSFLETEFNHKPSLQEVKDAVLNWYNEQIDQKIYSGFTWNNMPVWLSTENQFNYKAAFDLATQTGGKSLPVTFKFGSTNNPQYWQFTSVEELADFYQRSMQYVTTVLNEGWALKDSLNWDVYSTELDS